MHAADEETRYGEVLAARLATQQEMGRWLSETLSEVFHPDRVSVAVSIILHGELLEIVNKETRPAVDMKLGMKKNVKLPGLPATSKEVGAPGMSFKLPGTSRTHIQHEIGTRVAKVSLHLFVEEDMPEERVEELKTLAGTLAGIEPGRGDTIEVTAVDELPPTAARQATGLPLWVPILVSITVLVSCLILAVAVARRGGQEPFRPVGDWVTAGLGVAGGRASAARDEEDPTRSAGRPNANGQSKKPLAFAFLADATDDEVVRVLSYVDPAVAAIVLDQLPVSDEVGRRLLKELSEDRQLQLAADLGTPRLVPTTQLEDLEGQVEEALAAVRSHKTVGSQDSLATLLEQASQEERDRLMAKLVERYPTLGEAVRQRIMVFDDLGNLPREPLRQVVAEVDPTITARALYGAPEPLREAVLGAVSRRLRGILTAEAEGLPENERAAEAVSAARQVVERAMRRVSSRRGRGRVPS